MNSKASPLKIGWPDNVIVAALSKLVPRLRSLMRKGPVEGWRKYRPQETVQLPIDQEATSSFFDVTQPRTARYEMLFRYFLWGAQSYVSPGGALVSYRGLPSVRGFKVSGLEGFARTAPLFAAWLFSGRPSAVVPLDNSEPVDIAAWIARGLAAGTDPGSPEYWGEFRPDDQRIVEAADIARTVWLTRETAWRRLSAKQQFSVIGWLRAALDAQVNNDNNWLLLQPVIGSVLKTMGFVNEPDWTGYHEFMEHHLENGWFRDGPEGEVDFYNTWGIAYDLFWIHKLNPGFDTERLKEIIGTNGELTLHLISPAGIPILGRSICYRTAVPCSVLAAAQIEDTGVIPSRAARALDATWSYFLAKGILRGGTMTIGYFETDPAIVDYYSGAGSAHWGLRSLVLAFLEPEESVFWKADPSPLPVELSNYRLDLMRLGWVVEGKQSTGEIVVHQITIDPKIAQPDIEPYSLWARLKAQIFHRPFRPLNFNAKYRGRSYHATHPFCIESRLALKEGPAGVTAASDAGARNRV